LRFDHWQLDGEPGEAGLKTIEIVMTADREAVAIYCAAEGQ
jgi:hypothetical protein